MAQIDIKLTSGSNVSNPTTGDTALFISGSNSSPSLHLKTLFELSLHQAVDYIDIAFSAFLLIK